MHGRSPRALTDSLAAGGGEAKPAFEALITMKKIEIAAIQAARRGSYKRAGTCLSQKLAKPRVHGLLRDGAFARKGLKSSISAWLAPSTSFAQDGGKISSSYA